MNKCKFNEETAKSVVSTTLMGSTSIFMDVMK